MVLRRTNVFAWTTIPLLLLFLNPVYAHEPAEKFLSPVEGPAYALAVIIIAISISWAKRRGFRVSELVLVTLKAVRSAKFTALGSALGMAAFYTTTTALNWYSYIPDWVPYYPKLWAPDNRYFAVYALTWRLSKNWQINYNAIHGAYLLALSLLFAITMSLLVSLAKLSRANRCEVKAIDNENVLGAGLGIALNLLASFSCCIPAFMLFLYPSALVILTWYFEDALGSVGIAVIAANNIFLSSKLIQLRGVEKR